MRMRRNGVILASVGAVAVALLVILGSRPARPEPGMTTPVGTDIGQRAPHFAATTTDGTPLRSEDLRGQVIVLTSAAAWCGTCAQEAEQLANVYQEHGGRGVTFVTVDIDPQDTPEAINVFRTRTQTPWAYASASGAAQLIRDFRLSRFEITYVIDAQGAVRYHDSSITSAADLEDILGRLL